MAVHYEFVATVPEVGRTRIRSGAITKACHIKMVTTTGTLARVEILQGDIRLQTHCNLTIVKNKSYYYRKITWK